MLKHHIPVTKQSVCSRNLSMHFKALILGIDFFPRCWLGFSDVWQGIKWLDLWLRRWIIQPSVLEFKGAAKWRTKISVKKKEDSCHPVKIEN